MSRVIAALIVIAMAGLAPAGVRYGGADAFAAPQAAEAREPARQVPVEDVEDPAEREDPTVTGSVRETDTQSAPRSGQDEPERHAAPDDGFRGGAAAETGMEADGAEQNSGTAARGRQAFPGAPLRKPAKPPVPIRGELRPDTRKTPLPRPAREKYLCKALQACRNEFIRCKSKIKYPDQSKQWSIAKEACGAEYNKCVHKDFAAGQWFFTRWFYFQKLNCE